MIIDFTEIVDYIPLFSAGMGTGIVIGFLTVCIHKVFLAFTKVISG